MRGLKLLAIAAALAGAVAAVSPPPASARGALYGQVEDEAGLVRVFRAIRAEVAAARTRADLTRLYRRAGYLVTLTASRPWRIKFGDSASKLQGAARREFKATAEAINRRAADIGTEPDYAEDRGEP